MNTLIAFSLRIRSPTDYSLQHLIILSNINHRNNKMNILLCLFTNINKYKTTHNNYNGDSKWLH